MHHHGLQTLGIDSQKKPILPSANVFVVYLTFREFIEVFQLFKLWLILDKFNIAPLLWEFASNLSKFPSQTWMLWSGSIKKTTILWLFSGQRKGSIEKERASESAVSNGSIILLSLPKRDVCDVVCYFR